ncbi:DUF6495 family protein [Ulvibacter antarcticus]|uniref:Histidyl-tRNA synthetase n=1 Tax=Ulvibacter antarcticus TaxID=442714 RepID=A0A3L9YV28_9FLAO|nr:DUF6495 family protein [Ulvibacter antarcticus]RMA64601.1 hypothetical protein BXY75_1478 [Ulvibacter antarcticus]
MGQKIKDKRGKTKEARACLAKIKNLAFHESKNLIIQQSNNPTLKYTRLTKEQFESLNKEFITFLATQSITGDEWTTIKEKQPEVAEQELDIFSDLVWEGVLKQATYLENISAQQLFLFEVGASEMSLIVVKVTNEAHDITSAEGYKWLQQNFASDEVEFFTSSKAFSEDKNADIFGLIKQGAAITKGELYRFFEKFVD